MGDGFKIVRLKYTAERVANDNAPRKKFKGPKFKKIYGLILSSLKDQYRIFFNFKNLK